MNLFHVSHPYFLQCIDVQYWITLDFKSITCYMCITIWIQMHNNCTLIILNELNVTYMLITHEWRKNYALAIKRSQVWTLCSDVQDSLSSLMLINCDSEDTLACVPGSRHTRLQFDLLKYVNLTCCFFSRSSLNMDWM